MGEYICIICQKIGNFKPVNKRIAKETDQRKAQVYCNPSHILPDNRCCKFHKQVSLLVSPQVKHLTHLYLIYI